MIRLRTIVSIPNTQNQTEGTHTFHCEPDFIRSHGDDRLQLSGTRCMMRSRPRLNQGTLHLLRPKRESCITASVFQGHFTCICQVIISISAGEFRPLAIVTTSIDACANCPESHCLVVTRLAFFISTSCLTIHQSATRVDTCKPRQSEWPPWWDHVLGLLAKVRCQVFLDENSADLQSRAFKGNSLRVFRHLFVYQHSPMDYKILPVL